MTGSLGGYKITRLEHSLQTATRARLAGADVNWVVAALMHDIGDELAPYNHSELAASVLQPYVPEEVHWVVLHHGVFQSYYYAHHLGGDRNLRDRYIDHRWAPLCLQFCAEWDQNSFDPDFPIHDLASFEDDVHEVLRPSGLGSAGRGGRERPAHLTHRRDHGRETAPSSTRGGIGEGWGVGETVSIRRHARPAWRSRPRSSCCQRLPSLEAMCPKARWRTTSGTLLSTRVWATEALTPARRASKPSSRRAAAGMESKPLVEIVHAIPSRAWVVSGVFMRLTIRTRVHQNKRLFLLNMIVYAYGHDARSGTSKSAT